MLRSPLPALNDLEGDRVPPGLPPVVDAHVHVFPDALFGSIRGWFDRHGWPIRYRMKAADVAPYLVERGVDRVVALCYAHRPGVARELNRFMVSLAAKNSRVIALAAVYPGEEGASEILEEAFEAGLCGVKLHAHVLGIPVDDASVLEVAEVCEQHEKPIVYHAGREPRSPAYRCDPHEICSAARVERILRAHPKLDICVPHLGMDETDTYRHLIERYDHLWLDTTMALAGYLPGAAVPSLKDLRTERILYGTDFPNIPYAWDRELRVLLKSGLSDRDLARILGENARRLFSIDSTGGDRTVL